MKEFDLADIDADRQLLELNRVDWEDSLYLFTQAAWPYMDPAPFVHGWHMDVICDHIEYLIDGGAPRKLLVNLPPRHCKSLLLAVALGPWIWAQRNISPISGPGVAMLYASYADKLSLRDSVKCRRLIESPWYQKHWGHRYQLNSDQNTKSRFTNDKGGDRLITSIDAGVTGEGASILLIDDPNAANDVSSQTAFEKCIEWYTTALPTRFNDPKTGIMIVIQQRLAEKDLSGHVLEREADDWIHVCLPGRYEPERSYPTITGWKDPRTAVGQLLWPERFDEESIRSLEKQLGPYNFAGQIQQRPEPKGGGIIKRDWWLEWKDEQWPAFDFILGVVDTAYTTDEANDPSGMMIWGIYSNPRPGGATRIVTEKGDAVPIHETYSEFAPHVMLMNAWDEHLEVHDLVTKVAKTCKEFRVDHLVIENKASGISVAQEIRRLYSRESFGVELFDPKSQDKTARLYSVQHIFAEGIVYAPDRPWVNRVIDQVGRFPRGAHDEYVDLTSMGLRKLRDMGLLIRKPEREAEIEEEKRYPGRQEPLYSV